MIFKICNRLADMNKFRSYPFKEDMIGDAYLTCLKYGVNSYDIKRKNPFAYFSMIAYQAFIRRIGIEKKELYTKYKTIQHCNIMNLTSENGGDEYPDDIYYGVGGKEYMDKFIKDFENAEKKRKKNSKKT